MVSVFKYSLCMLSRKTKLIISPIKLPKYLSTGCNLCVHNKENENTVTSIRVKEHNAVRPMNIKAVLNNCKADDHVRIQGWVKGFRKQKQFIFLDICDGLSFHRLPVVLPAEKKPKDLNIHTSVDIQGVLVQSPNNPAVLELHPLSEVVVLGSCDQIAYPFAGKSKYTQDYIRQYIHLRPKTKKFSSLLRLRSATTKSIHDFFYENDFIQIHTPILTSNDCEGAGEVFLVRPGSKDLIKKIMNEATALDEKRITNRDSDTLFFDKKVHLTVSSQLHLESAVSGLEKVWTFSPVFRAENQKSTRHLSEFYMVEAELAFAYDIEKLLEIMEELVKFCIRRILTDNIYDWNIQTDEDKNLRGLLEHMLKHPFTVMTFEEAKNILKSKAGSEVIEGKGLNREQELILVDEINNGVPVFVIDWPRNIKPFYMRECNYDSTKVSAVDLLVPTVGELCGGSLREARLENLELRISELDPSGTLRESLTWYLDLRKFGGVPSGGFGLGFDRLMQLITGVGNIKDVSPFPRWVHNCPM